MIDEATFEVAQAQLALGEYLRRARAPRDARAHLRAAHDYFLAAGAGAWADRAAAELRATAPTRRRADYSTAPALTAQELQIASLAAAGLTNKEIGQRLYLSPRTVSNHLYRLFPKLGISRRAGLRDALNAMTLADETPLRTVA
jgi:DNA-binding NarL/FixJ family response regulator